MTDETKMAAAAAKIKEGLQELGYSATLAEHMTAEVVKGAHTGDFAEFEPEVAAEPIATRTCVCGNPAPPEGACPECGSTESLQTSAAPAPHGPLDTIPVEASADAKPARSPEQQAVIDKTLAAAPKLRTVL